MKEYFQYEGKCRRDTGGIDITLALGYPNVFINVLISALTLLFIIQQPSISCASIERRKNCNNRSDCTYYKRGNDKKSKFTDRPDCTTFFRRKCKDTTRA